MAAFETLLHRFTERPDIDLGARQLETFDVRAEPPLEKAWLAWSHAQRALHRGQPHEALVWLKAGLQVLSAHADQLCQASLHAVSTRCWLALDEPREAAGTAVAAWAEWLMLARKPEPAVIVPSARALLKVISAPHAPPRISDTDIYVAWLGDVFTREFHGAAQQLISVYADLQQPVMAQRVADEYLEWVQQFVPSGGGSSLTGVLVAGIALPLGDAYDRCGDSTRALAIFEDGLARLAGLPEHPEIASKRAQLQFNAANQLAKLARLQEAVRGFELARDQLQSLGRAEAVLRARYAIAFSRFKLGEFDDVVSEISELATHYESVLAASRAGPDQLQARQGLDRVYRLWLRLLAETAELQDVRTALIVLHLLFALKEEEGKFVQLWERAQAGQTIHSEISVMAERINYHPGAALLILEQVPEAFVIVALRAGTGAWHTRLKLQLLPERLGAKQFVALMQEHRAATEQITERAMPVRGPMSVAFATAAKAAWDAIDPQIRNDIQAADTLIACTDSQTDLDEFPLELLHDGADFLGLTKQIVRLPSLRDVNLMLGENRSNAAAVAKALIVRSDDNLAQADAEAATVGELLAGMGISARSQRGPAADTLMAQLAEGVDILHYVGHGLADEIGEELPLGPHAHLTARHIDTLYPAPAPLTVLSACLAGRARQSRTGEERGFATSLLRRGAPAVIAASYLVPDHVASEYVVLLYNSLRGNTLLSAVRDARRILADEDVHPSAWACFVCYGRPNAPADAPHASAAHTWPSAVFRYLATGAESYLEVALQLLHADGRLAPEDRAEVSQDLACLAAHDATHFAAADSPHGPALSSISEALFAASLIRTFGFIRHGSKLLSAAAREEPIRRGLSEAMLIERVLGDTYLLVATAVEIERLGLSFIPGDAKDFVRRARRRLRWLSADEVLLQAARSILEV